MTQRRYFVDMDGVIAVFNFNATHEDLLKEGYFAERPSQKSIIEAVKKLARTADVYILSAVLMDSEYALFEKHDWLDRELNIPCKYRIFTICGEDKIASVPAFDPETDILIDDYGPNCKVWEENGGRYIKVSVDAEDAEYEQKKHAHVIHPEMTADEILKSIKEV